MIDRGKVVKYQASVTLDPSKVTEYNTPASPIRAFLVSLQGNLAQMGLLIISYKISKASGKYQFVCSFILQTSRQFVSKQDIVATVDNQITQTTGNTPRWSMDPPVSGGAYAGASVCATCCATSTLGLNPWARFTAWIHNAAYGTLNCCQANALTAQERNALIQAGLNPCVAAVQARLDVNTTLGQNCAAPSQSCFWNSPGLSNIKKFVPAIGLPFLGIALGVLLLVVFVNAKASH
jgi:hypothetical protein